MRRESNYHVSRNEQQGQRRPQPGQQTINGPIFNWRLLLLRVWQGLKRLVAECWYLLLRRRSSAAIISARSAGTPMMRGWINPVLKVAAALVLFFYFTQRDIQFSIQMKAPLGGSSSTAAATQPAAGQMSMVQPVRLLGGGAQPVAQSNNDPEHHRLNAGQVEQYIERFGQVARAEMNKYGIPASVSMAQAILESQAGQSVSAQVDNNHFGAPMGDQTYDSAWRNWREHSLLLLHRTREQGEIGNDYRAWARAIQQIGYSDNPNYANELLSIIDRFHLEQLDESTI